MIERTLVIIKPDGVRRGLVGSIISVFEGAGLRLVAMKMVKPTRDLIFKHYPDSREWLESVGSKTCKAYEECGLDLREVFGTGDKIEIGRTVKSWLVDYLTSGDVVAVLLEGNAAVANVRRLCGDTFPMFADPGSIRGRYSLDSPDAANSEKRAVHNLVHASANLEEARFEISLWFPELRD